METLESTIALILAPHPDDEVFGCGGLISRIKSSGGKVYVMYIAAGTTLDFSAKGKTTANERIDELTQVADFLSLDGYSIALPGDQYHLKLDTVPQKDLIHQMERGNTYSLENLKPNMVLIPPLSDYNQDHRAIHTAAITALRPAAREFKHFVPTVLTYELPYHQWNIVEALPSPHWYVTLSEKDLQTKTQALQLYSSQMKSESSPLSVAGVNTLAAYRGLQCGHCAAEAYWINRHVS